MKVANNVSKLEKSTACVTLRKLCETAMTDLRNSLSYNLDISQVQS